MIAALECLGWGVGIFSLAYILYVVFFQSRTVELFDDDEDLWKR